MTPQASQPAFLRGWRVERFAQIGSTNDEARARALGGDAGRLWIVAAEQIAGRGRHGRIWSSPPGNLYASALIVDPAPVALAAEIGFVAGVALAAAVGDLGGADIRLKWPNDLVRAGAKLAGLLAEGVAMGAGRFATIVGFGVNCASSPEGLAYPTTNLAQALGRPIAPEALLETLIPRFDEALSLWNRGAGFAAIRARWLANAAGLGAPARIGGREGLFETLDAHGRLVLRRGEALETFETGDLFFPDTNETAPARVRAEGAFSQ